MGNLITRIWWGGDPDMPDLFSGLTQRDIYHVQSSWTVVYAQSGYYGMQMFLRLFRKDPNTKAFFKAVRTLDEAQITTSYQFKAHVRNLMGSINTCVEHLLEPHLVAALMNTLGTSHCGRNVEKAHFQEFRDIWTEILEIDLKMNEQVMSWNKFIDFIYKYIYEKLDDKCKTSSYLQATND